MKCLNCGNEIYDDDVFCGHCGENINELNAEEEKRRLELLKLKSADDLVIDCEGNKFKAIKIFKEMFNVDNDTALKYIDNAMKKFANNEGSQELEQNLYDAYDEPLPTSFTNPNGIKKTIIVGTDSRKKATSAVTRGLIGGAILGPVGLLAGASAKNKNVTTFQVIYNNGKQKTVTVKNNSRSFKEYCKYLAD